MGVDMREQPDVTLDMAADADLPEPDLPPDLTMSDSGMDMSVDLGPVCQPDETRVCYTADPFTAGVGLCVQGIEGCVDGDWSGECIDEITPVEDMCDALDNDCDGTIDEDCPTTTVSMTARHGCAIHQGNLYCFGTSRNAGLGLGAGIETASPTRVGSESQWQKVAVSDRRSCGLLDGSLWCWGFVVDSLPGGDVTIVERPEPYQLSTETDWTDVAVGDFACGIRNGELWCWGVQDSLNGSEGRRLPTRVGPRDDWTDIDIGDDSICGVAGGELYCWGEYLDQEIDESQPLRIGSDDDWHRVDVFGFRGHCALKVGGELFCWGSRRSVFRDAASVDAMPQKMTEDDRFWEISGALGRACALREDEAWCLGENDGRHPLVAQDVSSAPQIQVPHPGVTFSTIGVARRICGMTPQGFVCWGEFNPEHYPNDPDPEAYRLISDSVVWDNFEIGYNGSCGISSGDLYCWGRPPAVGLQLTFYEGFATPTLVDDTRNWTDLALYSTWGYGVADGLLYSWGGGAPNYDAPPTVLDATPGWTEVDGLASDYCGLRNGALFCWEDRQNQVTQVGTATDWETISAGDDHFCGIRSGVLFCWGDNTDGKLGIGSTSDQAMPTQVGTATDWSSVYAGNRATCGLRGSDLYCWGNSSTIGRRDDALSPILYASNVVAATAPTFDLEICYSTATELICGGNPVATESTSFLAKSTRAGTCVINALGELHCIGPNSYYRWGQTSPHVPILMPLP